jgi:hypothetical protein
VGPRDEKALIPEILDRRNNVLMFLDGGDKLLLRLENSIGR